MRCRAITLVIIVSSLTFTTTVLIVDGFQQIVDRAPDAGVNKHIQAALLLELQRDLDRLVCVRGGMGQKNVGLHCRKESLQDEGCIECVLINH
ncbi:hypothetical protein D3C81_1628810 [compost metagenome]